MEVETSLAVTRPFLAFAAGNFVSSEPRRPQLAGIHMTGHPLGGIVLVASDGYRMLLIWDQLGYFSGRAYTWYGHDTVHRKLHARKRKLLDDASLAFIRQERAPMGEILLIQDANLRTVQSTWEADKIGAAWEILATGTPEKPLLSRENFEPWRKVFPRFDAEVTTQGAPFYSASSLLTGLEGLAPLRPKAVSLVPKPVLLPQRTDEPTFRAQGGLFRIIPEDNLDFEAMMLLAPLTAPDERVALTEPEWFSKLLDS
jgi:hypothetical protein